MQPHPSRALRHTAPPSQALGEIANSSTPSPESRQPPRPAKPPSARRCRIPKAFRPLRGKGGASPGPCSKARRDGRAPDRGTRPGARRRIGKSDARNEIAAFEKSLKSWRPGAASTPEPAKTRMPPDMGASRKVHEASQPRFPDHPHARGKPSARPEARLNECETDSPPGETAACGAASPGREPLADFRLNRRSAPAPPPERLRPWRHPDHRPEPYPGVRRHPCRPIRQHRRERNRRH